MFKPSIAEVEKVMKSKNYKIFYGILSINIVGIRTEVSNNSFNDTMCIIWSVLGGERKIVHFPCTTKPGKHWLLNPMSKKGTFILKEGQYRDMWKLDLHNKWKPTKSYEALVQKSPVDGFRDTNKDSVHDYSGKVYTGIFGINGHRASKNWWSKFVDKWSAGCQVVVGPENYKKFIEICKESVNKYGNSLTYTLLNKNDFIR